jgi:predicted RNA-binding Zn-ribbon protein involved in translation (DUF1610 family)
MAIVKASCPSCGDVEMTTADVAVQLCTTTDKGSYSFRCPACRMLVSKPAEPRVVKLLASSGVRMTVWQMPAELEEDHSGEPVSYDDLLEFHFQLQQGGWFEAVRASVDDGR